MSLREVLAGGGGVKSIQTGVAAIGTSNVAVTISSVDSSKCFVLINGSQVNSGNGGAVSLVSLATTALTLVGRVANTSTSWQVVEFK